MIHVQTNLGKPILGPWPALLLETQTGSQKTAREGQGQEKEKKPVQTACECGHWVWDLSKDRLLRGNALQSSVRLMANQGIKRGLGSKRTPKFIFYERNLCHKVSIMLPPPFLWRVEAG